MTSMHVAHSCLNQRRECLVDTRGSERLYLQAPLSRPPPRARGPAKQEKVGRALSRHARTVTVLLAVAPSGVKDKQVKSRQDWKNRLLYCNGEPLHRLDLRLASSFSSSSLDVPPCTRPHAAEPSAGFSDLTYPCFRFQHSKRYHGTRDLPGYEYTERQPPGST